MCDLRLGRILEIQYQNRPDILASQKDDMLGLCRSIFKCQWHRGSFGGYKPFVMRDRVDISDVSFKKISGSWLASLWPMVILRWMKRHWTIWNRFIFWRIRLSLNDRSSWNIPRILYYHSVTTNCPFIPTSISRLFIRSSGIAPPSLKCGVMWAGG